MYKFAFAYSRAAMTRGNNSFASLLATYNVMRMLQLDVDSFNQGFASFVYLIKYCALALVPLCGWSYVITPPG